MKAVIGFLIIIIIGIIFSRVEIFIGSIFKFTEFFRKLFGKSGDKL